MGKNLKPRGPRGKPEGWRGETQMDPAGAGETQMDPAGAGQARMGMGMGNFPTDRADHRRSLEFEHPPSQGLRRDIEG